MVEQCSLIIFVTSQVSLIVDGFSYGSVERAIVNIKKARVELYNIFGNSC